MSTDRNDLDTTKFPLLERDRHNELWLRLREHLQARLESMRRKNDAANLTAEQTALLRGRIAELKNLLAAGEGQDKHE